MLNFTFSRSINVKWIVDHVLLCIWAELLENDVSEVDAAKKILHMVPHINTHPREEEMSTYFPFIQGLSGALAAGKVRI